VEKCSVIEISFGLMGRGFGEGWRDVVVGVLLASLTGDVANAELCLGHSDGCSSEHEMVLVCRRRRREWS
jgi:hypothetical protein